MAGARTSLGDFTRDLTLLPQVLVNVKLPVKPDLAAEGIRKAVTAAETAPAPCSARPAISQPRVGAAAAMKLPAANTSRPSTITFLRPKRSEARP